MIVGGGMLGGVVVMLLEVKCGVAVYCRGA